MIRVFVGINSPIMSVNQQLIPTKIQNQLSQLQLIFKGPLVKDSIVETVNDLTTLDTRYNYEHKIVWVKEAKSNYFLIDGDGSSLSHWDKVSTSALIPVYNSSETYQENDIVLYLGKLYIALGSISENKIPIDNKDLWQAVSADSVSYRYIFNQQSSIVFYTDVTNPIFEVGTCTFEIDSNDNYVIGTDGLIKTIGYEVIGVDIKQRTDLPNNNGRAYELKFYENNLPKQLTGVINIR